MHTRRDLAQSESVCMLEIYMHTQRDLAQRESLCWIYRAVSVLHAPVNCGIGFNLHRAQTLVGML